MTFSVYQSSTAVLKSNYSNRAKHSCLYDHRDTGWLQIINCLFLSLDNAVCFHYFRYTTVFPCYCTQYVQYLWLLRWCNIDNILPNKPKFQRRRQLQHVWKSLVCKAWEWNLNLQTRVLNSYHFNTKKSVLFLRHIYIHVHVSFNILWIDADYPNRLNSFWSLTNYSFT